MRFRVTSGTGFISSLLCEHLVSDWQMVIEIDNFSTSRISNLGNLAESNRFTLVETSILNSSILNPLTCDTDCVFHFAAVVGAFKIVKIK